MLRQRCRVALPIAVWSCVVVPTTATARHVTRNFDKTHRPGRPDPPYRGWHTPRSHRTSRTRLPDRSAHDDGGCATRPLADYLRRLQSSPLRIARMERLQQAICEQTERVRHGSKSTLGPEQQRLEKLFGIGLRMASRSLRSNPLVANTLNRLFAELAGLGVEGRLPLLCAECVSRARKWILVRRRPSGSRRVAARQRKTVRKWLLRRAKKMNQLGDGDDAASARWVVDSLLSDVAALFDLDWRELAGRS